MNKTTFWAVKLNQASRDLILTTFPPIHPNVYAEHMTIVFKPNDQIDAALMKEKGNSAGLKVIGYEEDDKGQALVVDCAEIVRIGGGIAHITISCANGTKPVYSGQMLQKNWNPVLNSITLYGTIARFVSGGWDSSKY
jgi:hypothetical protein